MRLPWREALERARGEMIDRDTEFSPVISMAAERWGTSEESKELRSLSDCDTQTLQKVRAETGQLDHVMEEEEDEV